MRQLNRQIVVGTAVALVVVVALWWLVLWSPRSKSYDATSKAAEAAQAQVTQLQSELARLNAARNQLPELEADEARLTAAIPATPQLDQIILDINGAAEQSGVQFQAIAPVQPSAAASSAPLVPGRPVAPPAVKINLTVAGGYQQVLDFMSRLYQLARLLVIDNVSVTSGGAGGAELTVSMTARVFTTQVPPAPGATTTTTTPSTGSTTTTTTPTTGSPTTTSPTIPPGAGPIG